MKKRGFTLIELLSVIVILAIIALIATPIIMGVIEDSKKGAAKSSALGYIDAVEKQIAINAIKNTNLIVDDVYEVSELTVAGVKVKGDMPSDVSWVKINNKQVTAYSLKINNYIINLLESSSNIEVLNNAEIATKPEGKERKIYYTGTNDVVSTIYFNPTTNKICDESEYNSNSDKLGNSGCLKWYSIENSNKTQKTLDVILDHNFKDSNLTSWSPSNILKIIDSNTSTWSDSLKRKDTYSANNYSFDYTNYKARIITADEVASIVGANSDDEIKWASTKTLKYTGNSINIESESGRIFLDCQVNDNCIKTTYSTTNGWQKQWVTSKGLSKYSWLFNYTYTCESCGCDVNASSNTVGLGYWTSTIASNNTYAWGVGRMGDLFYGHVSGSYGYGIRPVITINIINL